jgi:hypothetical protein
MKSTKNSILQICLNDGEKRYVKSILDEIFAISPPTENDLLHDCVLYSQELPLRIRKIFYAFKTYESHLGIHVINTPIDVESIGKTPNYFRELQENYSLNEIEVLHAIFGSLLGEPFGFKSQRNGHVFNTIIPLKDKSHVANLSAGSKFDFQFHTEDAFHDFSSDYLGLACVRNLENCPTIISSIQGELGEKMDEKIRQILFEHRFNIRSNAIHEGIDSNNLEKKPILFGDPKDPYIKVNLHDFRDEVLSSEYDLETINAIRILISTLESNKISVNLSSGDLLYIDNLKVVHGRSRYEPNWDNPRWLIRVIFTKDLRKSRSSRAALESRVIY